jgi:hypothetical protein
MKIDPRVAMPGIGCIAFLMTLAAAFEIERGQPAYGYVTAALFSWAVLGILALRRYMEKRR